MSVNYSKLHPVDMPVTDLDDGDDDMIMNSNVQPTHEQGFDPLEGFDYENDVRNGRVRPSGTAAAVSAAASSAAGGIGGFFSSIRNSVGGAYSNANGVEDDVSGVEWWASKIRNAGRSLRTNSYELQNRNASTGEFSFSDDDDLTLNNYGSGANKNKLRKFIWPGISLVLLIVCAVLIGTNNPFHAESSTTSVSGESSSEKIFLSNSTHKFHPTTIVISLDGFHPHYINAKLTPTLHNMFVKDYGAPYMIPSFPSLTFPNHWTLVTGLYPSEHGIVGNTFFDPELNRQFVNTDPKLGALDPEFWKGGEPIWETANKQGVKSAIHMWPGSEVPGIGLGNGPTFVDLFNGLELLSSKVDRVMGWLDIEDINERPELILTYVPTIDTIGHRNGIGGEELEHGLLYVDNFMHLMLLELQNRHLDDIVNVIVVSDHGMAPTSNERLLYIDEVIDLNEKIEHIDGWPLFGLRPKDNQRVEDVYNELVINLQKLPESINRHYPVYKVEDLPEKWHFGGKTHEHRFNYRLAPLWIIPDVGYSITTHKQMEENNNDYTPHGVHGYNNTELLMRAIFLGRGPYFDLLLSSSGDGNKKINPFPNTEVYNLICDTLNLSPSPNNGSFQTQSMAQSFAHPNRLISPVNLLHDWTDPLEFPDLPFEVDHIVEDATYDILFKKPPVDRVNPTTVLVSTNTNPLESLNSAATTLATLTEHKPKPLTESNKATPTAEPETEIDPESPEDDQKHHSSWSDLLSGITEDVGSLIGDVSDAFKDIFGSGHSKN